MALPLASSPVKHRVWLISDLQQGNPERAKTCLQAAVDDYIELQLPCEQIWYLGDALQGADSTAIAHITQIQMELLGKLDTPVKFVLGNHDLDLFRDRQGLAPQACFPLYDAVKLQPGWNTIEHLSSFYFFDTIGDYMLLFFSDHADLNEAWSSTHGKVHGDVSVYPYTTEHYRQVRETIASCGKPVIICGHYAFDGGNRPSPLLNAMLPLPDNVRIHFHGHAHIGDHRWAGAMCYQQMSVVAHQTIPQINISSLENRRGNRIRSAFLEIHQDGSMSVLFRHHDTRVWAGMHWFGAET